MLEKNLLNNTLDNFSKLICYGRNFRAEKAKRLVCMKKDLKSSKTTNFIEFFEFIDQLRKFFKKSSGIISLYSFRKIIN